MATATDFDSIRRCILRLAAEPSAGGEGRPIKGMLDYLDREADPHEVSDALRSLEADGLVRYPRPEVAPLEEVMRPVVATTQGKVWLRRSRATSQCNIRLPDDVRADLAALVGPVADSPSGVAVAGLREWVRMLKFPGIDFRWTPAGRRPHVSGTGLTVWELYRMWLDHGQDARRLCKNYPDLDAAQVQAAISYARAYRHEMPEAGFGDRPAFAPEVRV